MQHFCKSSLLFHLADTRFCSIENLISTNSQQAENKRVCDFVALWRKLNKIKRRFAEINRRFALTKRRFSQTKRRFAKPLFLFAKTDCEKAMLKGCVAREKLRAFVVFVGFFCTFAAQNFTKWQRT